MINADTLLFEVCWGGRLPRLIHMNTRRFIIGGKEIVVEFGILNGVWQIGDTAERRAP